ncbi:unnamed protein product [Leptosia nina]|uniref:Uncharacterized protein n=1 Tax=Leptosia nina TaxID=320188 RepID=A0AAV1IXQ8_9NEOP
MGCRSWRRPAVAVIPRNPLRAMRECVLLWLTGRATAVDYASIYVPTLNNLTYSELIVLRQNNNIQLANTTLG